MLTSTACERGRRVASGEGYFLLLKKVVTEYSLGLKWFDINYFIYFMRILTLIMILIQTSCSLYASDYPVQLGDSVVTIRQEKHGRGKVFIHVHQNETTALKAARAVIRKQGGSLITLVHSGQRNIVFFLHNQRYEFDPNRIYTDQGIRKTLTQFGAYSPEAHAVVKRFATEIKRLLPEGKIVAVHNNETYSLNDYLPGHSLASDARLLNKNAHNYYRNFYLVTQETDYHRLTRLNFNSVWQAMDATDDGSLSVYLAHRDYINVEAGYDQLAAQITMLQHA